MWNRDKINFLYCNWKEFERLSEWTEKISFLGVFQLMLIVCKVSGGAYELNWLEKLVFICIPVFVVSKIYCWYKSKQIKQEYRNYFMNVKDNGEINFFYYHPFFYCFMLLLILIGYIYLFIKFKKFMISYLQYEIGILFFLYAVAEGIFHFNYKQKSRQKCFGKTKTIMAFEIKNDLNYISYLLDKMQDKKLKEYIAHELYTYASRAKFYKRCHYFFSFISLAAPAIAIIFNNLSSENIYNKLIVSMLSAIASIATGVAGIVKFRESWIRYRSHCERLKREVTEYVNNIGEYQKQKMSEMEKQEIFYGKLKYDIINEEEEWLKLANK